MPIQGLFATSTGLIDFVIIEEELQQFATYAEAINTFSLQKLNELKEEFADYEVDWEGGEKVLRWKRNARFVTPATLLVTSYVLFEKSLKKSLLFLYEGKAGLPNSYRRQIQGKAARKRERYQRAATLSKGSTANSNSCLAMMRAA